MSTFPNTPTKLLTRIAAEASGDADEAAWTEFFGLYEPAMRTFLANRKAGDMAEDIVQCVFQKLVTILRSGQYDRSQGSFRAYLSTLLYREMVGFLRKASARGAGRHVPIDEVELPADGGDPAVAVDAAWREAVHVALVRHVLEETALAPQSKEIYAELEQTGASCADVARAHGLPGATVRQVKSRVDRMVRALERRYFET